MKITSWGRFPTSESHLITPRSARALTQQWPPHRVASETGIARGMGRSYGDSALADVLIETRYLDAFLALDESQGILHCGAGMTLETLLRTLMPKGWFLPVVPGTWYVSVGGAIASDVHGKNHHLDGSFSQHVESFHLLLGNGEIRHCSPQENAALFHATCGGMGLTGIILDVRLRLCRIQSSAIVQRTHRAHDLKDVFSLFEQHHSTPYSVAWLDCLASGASLGRSLLFLGEHATEGGITPPRKGGLAIPFSAPSFLLNRYSMSAFNHLYYHRPVKEDQRQQVQAPHYFFPLDRIAHWNRLYGRRGFLQYQCVLPEETALEGMTQLLTRISSAGKGSFLSVLKKLGPANENLLSFPRQGYTLALDFKRESSLFPLLDTLDQIVLAHGGRLYLAKDARMSQETFRRSYPRWEALQEIRISTGAADVFNSLQSKRLGF